MTNRQFRHEESLVRYRPQPGRRHNQVFVRGFHQGPGAAVRRAIGRIDNRNRDLVRSPKPDLDNGEESIDNAPLLVAG